MKERYKIFRGADDQVIKQTEDFIATFNGGENLSLRGFSVKWFFTEGSSISVVTYSE